MAPRNVFSNATAIGFFHTLHHPWPAGGDPEKPGTCEVCGDPGFVQSVVDRKAAGVIQIVTGREPMPNPLAPFYFDFATCRYHMNDVAAARRKWWSLIGYDPEER